MKRSISILLTAFLGVSLILGGCGGSGQGAAVKDTSASAAQTETPAPDSQETTSGAESEETGPSPADESGSPADSAKELTAGESGDEPQLTCQAGIRIGSLKGPTSMGLVSLMDKAAKGETSNVYEFTMTGKADELVGKIANGDLDIALVPANVASVLYNKTQGNVTVLDINTLGVLYVVASDDSIKSMAAVSYTHLAALLTFGRVNIGAFVAHADCPEITGILAGLSHTLAAVVGYYIGSNGTLLACSIDDLHHIGGVFACRTLALCQAHPLFDDFPFLIDTAAVSCLWPRYHGIWNLAALLFQISIPCSLSHLIENIMLQTQDSRIIGYHLFSSSL